MNDTKSCPFCESFMILAGYGWLCVNPNCPNTGNVQACGEE